MRLREALRSNSDSEGIVLHVRQNLYYINTLKPTVQLVVRRCFAIATRESFVANLVLVAGAVCASLFIRAKILVR